MITWDDVKCIEEEGWRADDIENYCISYNLSEEEGNELYEMMLQYENWEKGRRAYWNRN